MSSEAAVSKTRLYKDGAKDATLKMTHSFTSEGRGHLPKKTAKSETLSCGERTQDTLPLPEKRNSSVLLLRASDEKKCHTTCHTKNALTNYTGSTCLKKTPKI
ncbi:hypothetical protein WMY93_007148 [Mugilogobius chulae]|uniref:Uncharacterized protein n=1 Tax=Mugilogobius chulae TaxID=88201 RepID=A0AAW0Q1W3_9GOBI